VKAALLAVAVGLTLGIACGGGGGGIDAGIDASAIDTLAPDAVDRCQDLCACTMEFCADDLAACVAQCAGLDDSVRECRIEHCGYAQTNPGFHCPHALGDAQSTGVPPACIQN
jgi:hypothetical protein